MTASVERLVEACQLAQEQAAKERIEYEPGYEYEVYSYYEEPE